MKKLLLCLIFLLSFRVVEASGCDALLTREAAEFIADIVTIARIAVPILLIVLCSSDFVAIVTGQDEKVTKTSISRIIKRFIAAAAFFFVPLIIQLILGIDAVNNALNLVDDPSCGIDGDLDGYKSEEEIQKETEEKLDEDKKKEEIKVEIKCDKKGTYEGETYCAPNSNYRFGKTTQLDACNWNSVQHDSFFPEGTKVYAAFDGKAEFIQSACRDTLTGYGNYVKITSSSGTYVLYAHLSKFIDGVDMPLNKTCPKKADGSAPCPDVSGCTTQNVLKTVNVKAGQLIGYSGNIGNSTAPHLHVEIHYKGSKCIWNLNSAFGL